MHTNTLHSSLLAPRSLLIGFSYEKSYRRVGKTTLCTHVVPA